MSHEVTARSLRNLQVQVVAGQHSFILDEPPAHGGDGLGPSPIQVLCASLAACTVVTLQFVARHHGIPLAGVEVTVDPVRRVAHQEARGVPWRRKLRVASFQRAIRVFGELTDEQRELLLQGAANCPVDTTLSTAADIPTTLEVAPP